MVFEADIKKNLKNNYKKIGPLSRSEFFAVKSLTQRIVYVRRIGEITRMDWVGRAEKITPDQIQEGDTINVIAVARNMAGGEERQVSVKLDNIRAVEYDRESGFVMIDSEHYCLVNVDCKNDIDILRYLIANPNLWVNKEELAALIPANMTLEDFEDVKKEKEYDQHRKEPELQQEVHSLDLLF
jgi:hypothetical protein